MKRLGWALIALAVVCVLACATCGFIAIWTFGPVSHQWSSTAVGIGFLAVIPAFAGWAVLDCQEES